MKMKKIKFKRSFWTAIFLFSLIVIKLKENDILWIKLVIVQLTTYGRMFVLLMESQLFETLLPESYVSNSGKIKNMPNQSQHSIICQSKGKSNSIPNKRTNSIIRAIKGPIQ